MNITPIGRMLEDPVWICGNTEADALNSRDALASGLGVLLSNGHCDLDTVLADNQWFLAAVRVEVVRIECAPLRSKRTLRQLRTVMEPRAREPVGWLFVCISGIGGATDAFVARWIEEIRRFDRCHLWIVDAPEEWFRQAAPFIPWLCRPRRNGSPPLGERTQTQAATPSLLSKVQGRNLRQEGNCSYDFGV
jgi:hypothetical protein